MPKRNINENVPYPNKKEKKISLSSSEILKNNIKIGDKSA